MKLFSAAIRRPEIVLALSLGLFAAPLHASVLDLAPVAVSAPMADWASGAHTLRAARAQHKEISRDQAANIVKRKYGGKILAISEVQKGGRSMYRVKGLSDKSQVYVVFVDKQSGRISR